MNSDGSFKNYYEILQVDPNCDAKIIEAAYRNLAKRYHPDHPETADFDKFSEVLEAYRALRNPDDRANYNTHYAEIVGIDLSHSPSAEFRIDESVAVSDADAHAKLLMLLYKARRDNALDPGVSNYVIQELLNCSDERFEFHRWYLKAKGFIETTEQGTLAITIDGVDHVIAMSKTRVAETLLLAQSGERGA